MTIEEAIKKAIEGGLNGRWNPSWMCLEKIDAQGNATLLKNEQIFLDPAFWQSLGKAMGWQGFRKSSADSTWALYDIGRSTAEDFVDDHWIPEWKYRWHRFIDHLAEGKTAEDFFSSLP